MTRTVKLSEKVVAELSSLAMDRCEVVMRDVLQLVDDPQQKMVLSTNVSALMFGMAARFLQHHFKQKDGEMPPFDKAVDAVVYHVAKLAKETPPPYAGRLALKDAGE
jgi:intracellular sulfur oxidation DsrE/DsrF family protein